MSVSFSLTQIYLSQTSSMRYERSSVLFASGCCQGYVLRERDCDGLLTYLAVVPKLPPNALSSEPES